jgi:hypothetical protein
VGEQPFARRPNGGLSQASFAVVPSAALVGKKHFVQAEATRLKINAEQSVRDRVPFETGENAYIPAEPVVPVKGEDVHLRFVGSPSGETNVPLTKRRN